ncbi:hypothetical protein OPT61_g8448 [Boeremia exigua]|uniref:Uncharacterized protein n=1 Tax=Boeremia exigua TaxID=749465 RepID=A0ACC2HZC0_9PLEO|nr:hypothetical protein OPT61_g8448 [Boeremia exigua]
MVAAQFLVASLIAAASATSLVAREDAYFASLLKRQEPGTPAFACHESCGTAITLSRGSDPCNDDTFVSDYNECLKCAGPGNVNIWRYYGATLSTAGAKCGFPTEPEAGAASSAAPASTSAAAQSSAAPTSAPASSSAAAPSSSEAAATTEAATSEAPVSSAATPSTVHTSVVTPEVSSAATTSAAISSAPFYPTAIANGTLSSVSGVPSPSTNASASFTASAPIEISTNAAAGLRAVDAAGMVGAIFVGALFGM